MKRGPADPESWFAKGDSDLILSRRAMSAEGPLPDLSAYHAQQCAEKYLKGYLVAKSIPFRFVHDLGYLVHLCEGDDETFRELEDAVLVLTEYATESRYPREDEVPCTAADAQDAIRLAERVQVFVRQSLARQV